MRLFIQNTVANWPLPKPLYSFTALNATKDSLLLSFLMIFLPAHRAPSLDSALDPTLRSTYAPALLLVLS